MKALLMVFLGGGIGSSLRYLIHKGLTPYSGSIPYGTFFANTLGALFIGVVLGFSAKENMLSQNQTLFLATGICGGFTTFSTFAYENHQLLKSGDFMSFILYTIASFSIGIAAVAFGIYLVK